MNDPYRRCKTLDVRQPAAAALIRTATMGALALSHTRDLVAHTYHPTNILIQATRASRFETGWGHICHAGPVHVGGEVEYLSDQPSYHMSVRFKHTVPSIDEFVIHSDVRTIIMKFITDIGATALEFCKPVIKVVLHRASPPNAVQSRERLC
ncbi:hypothetical protein EVAR_37937_1 [Eumeta japonica]|uniref:Uncharacterized protein n=1 Tax=Eumeta variegata TaxID=151549 RepID=A0A4C1XC28_EUMVA|nr:hypothetical protein EVAR_37937_1 [Eumeta japonica]